jgi:hypothetical protein
MPIDLGSPIFEVALGLAFVFFLFSLVISSATEGIATLFQVREKKLEKGIERMLGEPDLAATVLHHPLIRPDVTTTTKRKPAYVSSRNFALALTQVLRKKGRDPTKTGGKKSGKGARAMKDVTRGVESYCSRSAVRQQLDGMLEQSHGSPVGFRTAVEHWFDDSMDRVSGWYRNWSQISTCILALVVAVGLNVDTIRIAERLGDSAALRTTVVKQAETTAEGEAGLSEPEEAGKNAEEAFGKVKGLNLPILWGEHNDNITLNTVAGWLITFLALSLGAPFWFDALGKLAHLKTAGKKPEPAK